MDGQTDRVTYGADFQGHTKKQNLYKLKSFVAWLTN